MANKHTGIKGQDYGKPARAGKGGEGDPHPGSGSKTGHNKGGNKGNKDMGGY